jgi:hypothetical protein
MRCRNQWNKTEKSRCLLKLIWGFVSVKNCTKERINQDEANGKVSLVDIAGNDLWVDDEEAAKTVDKMYHTGRL